MAIESSKHSGIKVFIHRHDRPIRGLRTRSIRAGEGHMAGKRHASEEIAAKLARASEVAARGKTRGEIAKALGVSIMTYHRWKTSLKATTESGDSTGRDKAEPAAASADTDGRVKQLELENSQLRQLFTDVMLEKLKLEQQIRAILSDFDRHQR